MDIGCHLPNQGPLANGESLVRFARAAEERGVATGVDPPVTLTGGAAQRSAGAKLVRRRF